MNADVFGEKSIGSLDRIVAEIALPDGEDTIPLDHGLTHSPIGKAGPHTMAGQKTEQGVVFIDYGKGAETEFLTEEKLCILLFHGNEVDKNHHSFELRTFK